MRKPPGPLYITALGVGLTLSSGVMKNNLIDGTTDTGPATGSGIHWLTGGTSGVLDCYTNTGALRLRVSQALAGVGIIGTFYTPIVRAGNITGATGTLSLVDAGGTTIIGIDTSKIGFFATAPVVKATVSGSKGANAALTSLMTALSGYGFVVDSTS